MLTLAICILEEVQATGKFEQFQFVIELRRLRGAAQVSEIRLGNCAFERNSGRRLASVRNDEIFVVSFLLPKHFIGIIIHCSTTSSSARRCYRHLLSAAIEDGNDIAAFLFRDASKILFHRVHARAIDHTIR